MFNLTDKNISYLIISPENPSGTQLDNKFLCDKLCNILYAKGYTLIPLAGYYEGNYDKTYIAIGSDNNDVLRKDSFYLMEEFNKSSAIIKYKNEYSPKRILNNGFEKLLSIAVYDSTTNGKIYIYNGTSFTFIEQKRYQNLTDKSQIRKGMIVEFFNNNKWVEKIVSDVDTEYEKMYKLLIKYNKLRICTN